MNYTKTHQDTQSETASELSNGQAVNGTTPIPSVMPPEIRQLHDLGLSSYGCPLPDCSEVLQGVDALTTHINTPHGASPAVADPTQAPTPSPKQGRLPDGSWFETNDDGKRVIKSVDPKLWGAWAAGTDGYSLVNKWAYDKIYGGYYQWDGRRWEKHKERGALMLWEDVMEHVPPTSPLRSMLMDKDRHAKPSVEKAITRPLEHPERHFLPVKNGMVDLRDGSIRAFDATLDTHREYAPTDYRQDWTDDTCLGILRGWFNPSGKAQLDEINFQNLLDLVGLMLSGQSQMYKSIVFFWGDSGSGKGGCLKILKMMLGELAQTISSDSMMFNKGQPSNHNGTLADIIVKQQIAALGSEIRGRSTDQLLEATGDGEMSARYSGAHGELLKGLIRCMFILTTTSAPTMPSERGMLRRLAVIRFDGTDADLLDKDRHDPPTEVLEAMLTLGIRRAAAVYGGGYEAPQVPADILKDFIAEADPLTDYFYDLAESGDLLGMADTQIEREFKSPNKYKPTLARIRKVMESFSPEWEKSEGRTTPDAKNKQRARYYFSNRRNAKPPADQLKQWANEEHQRARGVELQAETRGLVS